MKKIIAILLTTCLCFTFCSCSNKGSSSDDLGSSLSHSVDVAKLAASGRIPEVEFILGDSVDAVKDALFKISAGMSHEDFCDNMRDAGHEPDGTEYNGYVTTMESEGHTVMSSLYNEDTASSVYCMYTPNNIDAGISAIAVVGEVYGFDGNTLIDYAKNNIDAEYSEDEAKSNLYFLPKGSDGATCLTYELGAHKLELYFSQYNTFVAAVLYDTNVW